MQQKNILTRSFRYNTIQNEVAKELICIFNGILYIFIICWEQQKNRIIIVLKPDFYRILKMEQIIDLENSREDESYKVSKTQHLQVQLLNTTVVFIHKCCLSFPLIFCRPLYFQKCCHHFPLFWQNTILFFYKCHLCFPLFCRPLYFLFTNVFFVFHFFMDHCIFKTNVVFVFYFFLWTTAFSLMLSSFSLLYQGQLYFLKMSSSSPTFLEDHWIF